MPQALPIEPLTAMLRRHDRDRFLATLFAPASARPALWALLGFNLEIARAREAVSQPLLGQIRLQWWRDALAEAYEGRPVRRHMVATPLGEAIRAFGITRAHLDAMINGREHDFDPAPPESLAALEAYAESTSAQLLHAQAEVLGVKRPLDAVRHVGIAWALVGLIRAVSFHAAAGRHYLPAGEAGIEEVALAAREHLTAARRLRRETPRAALPALLPARVASTYLRRIAKAGFDHAQARVQEPDALAAVRMAWGYASGRY